MEKEKYDKIKYNMAYNKENYKKFGADLKKEEVEKANLLLKKYNLNKAEFIRRALKKLEENGEI